MILIAVQVLFWSGAAMLVYTFLGYPVVAALIARCRPQPVHKGDESFLPRVSAVVIVRNDEARIEGRVRNLLEADYPEGLLDVIVVSDGSTDGTEDVLAGIDDPRLRVIAREEQCGKASGLNAALEAATGDIVVMGDVRQQFASSTIRAFVRPFADASVGAACGSLEVIKGEDAVSGGVDAHWRLENFIRRSEAAVDSSIGYTGAICALRRACYSPIPEDTILDDVVIPMTVVTKGHRVVYETQARGTDPQPFAHDIERRRKRRTMAGNFQMLFRYPRWLFPWYNRLWWRLISHKYFRLLGFPLMLAVMATNILLLSVPAYRVLLAAQGCFYLLAMLGLALPGRHSRLIALPASFVFVNWQTMLGLADYVSGKSRRGWDKAN
ncbi:MAG: glycosyltransferase [Lentisphaerae bacterium]|nr:glycosyltransferase [Lentisphaerota bacterium]MBT5607035.1 glycosyltransferase [Lentisphaerota bacterium]MBT7055789.1 glycosyltransferase [Lentisphaerota bacterium]